MGAVREWRRAFGIHDPADNSDGGDDFAPQFAEPGDFSPVIRSARDWWQAEHDRVQWSEEHAQAAGTYALMDEILERLADALAEREGAGILAMFAELEEESAEYNLPLGDIAWEEVYEACEAVQAVEPSLIYVAPPPEIVIPKLIISASEALLQLAAKRPEMLFEITPRQFEELIAEIFHRRGFEVHLTQQTRDGGRDIIALHDLMGMKSKYLIECKRYAANRKVGLEYVQRLYGVKHAEAANKAVLVTTSGFSRDATIFAAARLWDLDLKAYDDVVGWVKSHGAA